MSIRDRDVNPLFVFPYSYSMQAYVFGNFEEQLAFNVITDDEVIEVLNEVNDITRDHTKASKTLVNFQEEGQSSFLESSNASRNKSKAVNQENTRSPMQKYFKSSIDGASAFYFFLVVVLPVLCGIVILTLYSTKIITGNEHIVNAITLYLPMVLGTSFVLFIHCRKFDNDHDNATIGSIKSAQIKSVLEKWNRLKFHPLGFSWTYNSKLDCLGLTVDADLEVHD